MKTCPIFEHALLDSLVKGNISLPDYNGNIQCNVQCGWFRDGSCAMNPEPLMEQLKLTSQESPEFSLFISQLKSNIHQVLQEKTGWGKNELEKVLVKVIDGTGNFPVPTGDEDLEDCPF